MRLLTIMAFMFLWATICYLTTPPAAVALLGGVVVGFIASYLGG